MKKFNDLTAADFPGYDEAKIEEWMAAAREANRNYLVFMSILLVICVIVSFALGALVLPGLLFLILAPWFIFRKSRRIEKELKLTRRAVMMARRGELVNPPK
jgi:hypothetical protein